MLAFNWLIKCLAIHSNTCMPRREVGSTVPRENDGLVEDRGGGDEYCHEAGSYLNWYKVSCWLRYDDFNHKRPLISYFELICEEYTHARTFSCGNLHQL